MDVKTIDRKLREQGKAKYTYQLQEAVAALNKLSKYNTDTVVMELKNARRQTVLSLTVKTVLRLAADAILEKNAHIFEQAEVDEFTKKVDQLSIDVDELKGAIE